MDVLLVADSTTMRRLLRQLLEREHGVAVVDHGDPLLALVEARTYAFDLVLVDHHMPQMDGVACIRELRAIPHYEQVPVAMITSDVCDDVRLKALEAGAIDFIDKRAKGIELSVRLHNLVRLAGAVRRLDEQAAVLAATADTATRRLREREAEIIFRLALAVEYRDNDTGDHTWRVARYSQIIAEALGLAPDFCQRLYLAAPLHDVGKVAVPDGILLKKGRLDEAEAGVMRMHPEAGARILGGSESDLIRLAAEIAEGHHERWDGSGYPHGLAGEAIPLSARIVAVADVFDALTTARPYKAAMAFEEALRIVEAERERHFDPACVDAFIAVWDRIRTVREALAMPQFETTTRTTDPCVRVPELLRDQTTSGLS